MSWSDPIVDEVRKARDAYAARFNYDLRAIYRDLKEQEEQKVHKITLDATHSSEEDASDMIGGGQKQES